MSSWPPKETFEESAERKKAWVHVVLIVPFVCESTWVTMWWLWLVGSRKVHCWKGIQKKERMIHRGKRQTQTFRWVWNRQYPGHKTQSVSAMLWVNRLDVGFIIGNATTPSGSLTSVFRFFSWLNLGVWGASQLRFQCLSIWLFLVPVVEVNPSWTPSNQCRWRTWSYGDGPAVWVKTV